MKKVRARLGWWQRSWQARLPNGKVLSGVCSRTSIPHAAWHSRASRTLIEPLPTFSCEFGQTTFAVLRAFDARRGSLSSYIRLVLRDILAQQVVALFVRDHNRGWKAIEHFFQRDIVRAVARHFPDSANGSGKAEHDEEAYQEICLRLVEDGYRRIRAYDGHGSFGGFMSSVINHLCLDLVRERFGRRRLPVTIRRLPEVEQEVFRQLYWKDCPEDQLAGALAQRQLPNSPADIARAVAAVRSAPGANRVNGFGAGDTLIPLPQPGDPDEIEDKYPKPDDDLIIRRAQAALDKASDRLRVAIDGLPAEMQCYAKLRFWDDLPPREIARVMNLSVTEIYRLRDKAEHMLELTLGVDEDVQKWRQAVWKR